MDFYSKYLKYKKKYYDLKGGMESVKRSHYETDANKENFPDNKSSKPLKDSLANKSDKISPTPESIFEIFTHEKLIDRELNIIPTEIVPKTKKSVPKLATNPNTKPNTRSYTNTDTPFIASTPSSDRAKKEIYTTLSTPDILARESEEMQEFLKTDINTDDTTIAAILSSDKNDPFILYENYGKSIECFIADYMKCPICQQYTLRRYYKNSMQVIDLVCINPLHFFIDGVKFFQVKTADYDKRSDTSFLPYIQYDRTDQMKNYIKIGSQKLGETVHNIKPSSPTEEKQILIGYICVYYREEQKQTQENQIQENIVLNLKHSFCVLPEIMPISRKLFINKDPNDWYYKYVYITDDKSSAIIHFNNTHNNIIQPLPFPSLPLPLPLPLVKVPKNYDRITSTKVIENPLPSYPLTAIIDTTSTIQSPHALIDSTSTIQSPQTSLLLTDIKDTMEI